MPELDELQLKLIRQPFASEAVPYPDWATTMVLLRGSEGLPMQAALEIARAPSLLALPVMQKRGWDIPFEVRMSWRATLPLRLSAAVAPFALDDKMLAAPEQWRPPPGAPQASLSLIGSDWQEKEVQLTPSMVGAGCGSKQREGGCWCGGVGSFGWAAHAGGVRRAPPHALVTPVGRCLAWRPSSLDRGATAAQRRAAGGRRVHLLGDVHLPQAGLWRAVADAAAMAGVCGAAGLARLLPAHGAQGPHRRHVSQRRPAAQGTAVAGDGAQPRAAWGRMLHGGATRRACGCSPGCRGRPLWALPG